MPNQAFYKSVEGISYTTIENQKQSLDLYLPDNKKPVPLLVFIHGGGFVRGDRKLLDNEAKHVTAFGYAAASIDYPLAANFRDDLAGHIITQVKAARCAIRFLKANAQQYGINPNKVVVSGQSAGATLASFIAGLGDENTGFDSAECEWNGKATATVQGGILQYGIYDFTMQGAAFFRAREGAWRLGREEEAKRVSSLPLYRSTVIPPMLLTHGSADTIVSPNQSVQLSAQLVKFGVKSAFIVIPGRSHGGALFPPHPDFREQACTAQAFLGMIFK